jgi:NADH dehydrogenase FAD-containing subunit
MKNLAFAIVSLLASSSDGFTPPSGGRRMRTSLHDNLPRGSGQEEKILREELQKRNVLSKEEEVKFGLKDGANMENAFTEDATPKPLSVEDTSSLAAKMEKMMQPRAYPLFLLEKAAEFVESSLYDATSFLREPKVTDKAKRERIVVLGTGWGSHSLLKGIDTDLYDVTVISPRNFFLFTPMLAGASVGTVEYRSITEPIREINNKVDYLEAIARSIDPKTKTVYCQSVICEGNSCDIEDFEVTYDKLVVTVGAQTNTFGIPGVREYCCFLKQVEDARRIRGAIVNCFERANIPSLTEEDRRGVLTFAVIGAGPTGIEFASELRDFVEEDGPKYYPKLLKYVKIKIIEAGPTVLAPFDKELQEEAIKQFERPVNIKDIEILRKLPHNFELTELILGASVKEVTEKTIILSDGREDPYGLAVWAGGNGPLPITLQMIDALGEEQKKEQEIARGRVAIDPWLRVIGGDGDILSFGDCSCITQGQLPATAQVASQQGEYLAQLFNKKYNMSPAVTEEGIFPPPKVEADTVTTISDLISSFSTGSNDFARPFQFLNLGILAYTGGGSALAQVEVVPEKNPLKGKGKIGNAIWRSVYLSKQVSSRNRLLVVNDWIRRRLFGRDITRV